jgi:hypothetical protein
MSIRMVPWIVLFTFASVNLAVAQDWQFEPGIRVGGEFDDNATLNIRTDEEVELKGYLLEGYADVTYSSPKSSFLLQPRFLIRNYPDEPDFDSDDLRLRSNYLFRGSSNTLGYRLRFDSESVRTAERTDSDLDIDDPEEISDTDSGRIIRFGTREKWRVSPFWNFRLSNTSSMRVDLDYIDTRYKDAVEGLLNDFTDNRVNLSYRRSISNVTTGVVTLTGRKFDTERQESDIEGVGALVGLEHSLSEKTKINAMIGMEDTDQGGVNTDPEVVGWVTLTRQLETIRMLARYARTITASGAGRLSARDTVNLNFSRRLSEKISAGLGVRAYQTNGLDGSITIDDRRYAQLLASFVWNLTRHLAVQADYRYTVLDRSDVLGERSNSNRINLWFVYQPYSVPDI